ncbi:putative S-adenosyl-L-methionine-dependent methyltransferase MAV-4444 [Porphyridium purpureum]|uniref:Putative S-adenosyl-L-methionine-dependent methyltransferase MAV-4444 n=1 Tax=Porphyridium purpureum TaxID=35688 RepID=A0A5J4YUU4_PORPP|nr:putative S-adenosyl-L-methionine-dependent methyltransferase MAV-4444 [Porphyridium purpureum]|eukprot:POR6793..scf209_3
MGIQSGAGVAAAVCCSALCGYVLIEYAVRGVQKARHRRERERRYAVVSSAKLVASWRALESERMDALLHDEFAEKLAGPAALQRAKRRQLELAQSATAPGSHASSQAAGSRIVVRSKYFDEWIVHAMRENPAICQVVMLGAGMDARAFRLPSLHDAVVFELDLPEIIREKTRVLREEYAQGMPPLPRCRAVIRIPCDLCHSSWARSLILSGFNPARPSLWVMEGLLYYLPEGAVVRLLENVADLSAPGSRMIASMVLELSAREKSATASAAVVQPGSSPSMVPPAVERAATMIEMTCHYVQDLFAAYEYYPSSFAKYPPIADYLIDKYERASDHLLDIYNSTVDVLNVEALPYLCKTGDGGLVAQDKRTVDLKLSQHFQWACPNPSSFIASFGLEAERVTKLGDSEANYGRIAPSKSSKTVYVTFFRAPLHPAVAEHRDSRPKLPDGSATGFLDFSVHDSDCEASQISEAQSSSRAPNATASNGRGTALVDDKRQRSPSRLVGTGEGGSGLGVADDLEDDRHSAGGDSFMAPPSEREISQMVSQLNTVENMLRVLTAEREEEKRRMLEKQEQQEEEARIRARKSVREKVGYYESLTGPRTSSSRTAAALSPVAADTAEESTSLSLSDTAAKSGVSLAGLRVQTKLQHPSLILNGSELRMVGNIPQLGTWSARDAPALFAHAKRNDLLMLEVELTSGDFYLEYKYVVVSKNGEVYWEKGPNRFCEVGAEETLVLNDVTRF